MNGRMNEGMQINVSQTLKHSIHFQFRANYQVVNSRYNFQNLSVGEWLITWEIVRNATTVNITLTGMTVKREI